jgi:hypothetical protein
MKRPVTFTNIGLDPGNRFGAAWIAAFLGLVLIISAVLWAVAALPRA